MWHFLSAFFPAKSHQLLTFLVTQQGWQLLLQILPSAWEEVRLSHSRHTLLGNCPYLRRILLYDFFQVVDLRETHHFLDCIHGFQHVPVPNLDAQAGREKKTSTSFDMFARKGLSENAAYHGIPKENQCFIIMFPLSNNLLYVVIHVVSSLFLLNLPLFLVSFNFRHSYIIPIKSQKMCHFIPMISIKSAPKKLQNTALTLLGPHGHGVPSSQHRAGPPSQHAGFIPYIHLMAIWSWFINPISPLTVDIFGWIIVIH